MQSAIGKFWTAYFDFNVLGVKWGRFGLRTRLARRRSELNMSRAPAASGVFSRRSRWNWGVTAER